MFRTLGVSQEEYYFIKCNCHTHALEVSQIAVSQFPGEPIDIGLAIWDHGKRRDDQSYSWRYRLRHIWHVITRGHPYGDEISFCEEEARQLAEILVKFADRAKAHNDKQHDANRSSNQAA